LEKLKEMNTKDKLIEKLKEYNHLLWRRLETDDYDISTFWETENNLVKEIASLESEIAKEPSKTAEEKEKLMKFLIWFDRAEFKNWDYEEWVNEYLNQKNTEI
jgi:septal ring factor EnvC (AmiA/AmiB activator)